MTEPKLEPKLEAVVARIRALRKLTKESGTITSRSQSAILRSLSDDELTAVAEVLAKE